MKTAEGFFKWAFDTRASTVLRLQQGEKMPPEKVFLSFCSHNPAFVSDGPAGLNASIKGIGFLPKDEYLEETLEAYLEHIRSYTPGDKEYSNRGLEVLVKWMYGEKAQGRIDFSRVGSLELAKRHSYDNYKVNPKATLLFYEPPAISFELRGQMEIHDENDTGKREIYQQFINAQHDVYHHPDTSRWLTRPAYIFRIKEVFDNSVSKTGFGQQMQYPY
ncbi:MAG: hypothetical protein GXZ04_01215 [Clostridiales bacterium]|nr:hypothetical protein [Clostridiales bacterium]